MNDDNPSKLPRILAVGGPTAIGKTSMGIALAKHVNGEVISADSVQLFRGFRIGAATPSPEEQQGVKHHLIACLAPTETITAADFARLADAAIHDILARGKTPIIVGGSGLYLRALLYGLIDAPARDDALRARLETLANTHGDEALWEHLHQKDPESAQALHPNDRVRIIRALEVLELTGKSIQQTQQEHRFQQPKYHVAGIGLTAQRHEIHRRINLRTQQMFDQGLIREVQELLANGVPTAAQPFTAIGYKEVLAFLENSADAKNEEAIAQLQQDIATHTRRFARRQLVWFRKEKSFRWVNIDSLDECLPQLLAATQHFLRGDRWTFALESEREASDTMLKPKRKKTTSGKEPKPM